MSDCRNCNSTTLENCQKCIVKQISVPENVFAVTVPQGYIILTRDRYEELIHETKILEERTKILESTIQHLENMVEMYENARTVKEV